MRPMLFCTVIQVAILGFVVSDALAQPRFTGLAFPPGGLSVTAFGLSPDGTSVVAQADSRLGFGAYRNTPIVGWEIIHTGVAYDASLNGEVVVGQSIPGGPGLEATRWTEQGGVELLGVLDTCETSQATAVSADGLVVVGNSETCSDVAEANSSGAKAFRWTQATGMIDIGDLPGGPVSAQATDISFDGRVIVGRSWSASGFEAFRWSSEEGMIGLGDLPGGPPSDTSPVGFFSVALATSADGSVVVGKSWSDSFPRGELFIWATGTGMVGLGVPVDRFVDVSVDGTVIVGESEEPDPNLPGFIWDTENGARSISDELSALGLDVSSWILNTPVGLSQDGKTIAGRGIDPFGFRQSWIAHLTADIPSEDADGDGEADATDACPDTQMGEAVDQAGCSLGQFCSAIDVNVKAGKAICRSSDWRNDEPIRLPFDCLPASGICVPSIACGLGFELALLVPGLMWVRQKRRSASAV